jgi:hypothetical protein
MDKGAQLSPCRTWRYVLWRIWDPSLPIVTFVGLNPSTADETVDDHTIRRCIGFAKTWGYGGIYMINLFAFRATKPADLKKAADPIGPDNDRILRAYHETSDRTVACWGNDGVFMGRDRVVIALLGDVYCLGTTKGGHPRHPARLRTDTKPQLLRSTR